MLSSRKCARYLVIWRIDEWERWLFLLQQKSVYFARWEKKSAYYHVIAVVGSFFPCLFQVGFEFLDGLVKCSIIAETFRLERIL